MIADVEFDPRGHGPVALLPLKNDLSPDFDDVRAMSEKTFVP